MAAPPKSNILRIVLIYSVFGGLWIYLSDTVLVLLVSDPAIISKISIYKGFIYVTLTALLLYFLISQYVRQIRNAEEEKLRLERQFQQTQKLESLGVLTGGIAHDFNNILGIILGHCSLARTNPGAQTTPEETSRKLQQIEKAAQRGAALCRQMLTYAGKEEACLSCVNFGELVADMTEMLRASVRQNAAISVHLASETPFINGDATQLRQVVMNLIINASEAIGETQGKVKISLNEVTFGSTGTEQDYFGMPIPAGNYLCLEVSDTGCGMNDETKRRLFEPFFTTKLAGRGLGMSAMIGILKAHRGLLQLASEPGRGTTFKIYLPALGKPCEPNDPKTAPEQPEPRNATGTVLLVEDEEDLRIIAKHILNGLGLSVIEAANGREGLAVFRQHQDQIKFVISDIGMPMMDGYQLFLELKKLRADLPIIISSGFGDGDITSKIARSELAGIVGKPYRPDDMKKVIAQVLTRLEAQAVSRR